MDKSSASPTQNSELVIALDPAQVGGMDKAAVLAHCERLYEQVLRSDGTQLPSTGRHCGTSRLEVREANARAGVEVPAALVAECEDLIEDPSLVTNQYLT